ncbi:MAG: hypothetical protein K6E91_01500, partial [Butyrivibrio sp.]|nr:hypothetical protein [Butyrivibrio sp.]
MDINEIENRRHKILEALSNELNENSIAAVLRKEEGAPEMISAMLDELGDGDRGIIGDFYFRPLQTEDDPVQVFTAVFTIANDVPTDRLQALYEAISYVNFAVPAGCFSIDKDHRFFCYALNTLLPSDLEDAQVFRQIDLAVGNAFFFADG